jgi:amino acid transporter
MILVLLAASLALLVYCATAYTVFAVRYSRLTWRRTREGRHLMGQSIVLAALLWATLLAAAVPLPLWLALAVQVVLFAWLAFEATRRNRLLSLNQREARAARNQ